MASSKMVEKYAQKREERIKTVYDILDAHRGESVSCSVLAEKLGVNTKACYAFMSAHFIPKYKEELDPSRTHGYMLRKLSEKEPEKTIMKNPEGYSDQTAGKAIASMGKALAGEIWKVYSHLPNAEDLVLVINSTDTMCVVLKLYRPEFGISPKYPVDVRYSGKAFVADAFMVCTKPIKYFKEKDGELSPTQMNFIKRTLAKALLIPTEVKVVEKPVEKIKMIEKPVEKIVEVPVEKIVEKVVEVKDDPVEIAVLRAEHALYKSIVDRLLERRRDDI